MQPSVALCNVCPSADICEPFREHINIAVCAVNAPYLQTEPIGGHMPKLMEVIVDVGQKTRVLALADAPEIGDPANIPQQFDRGAISSARSDFTIHSQRLECRKIVAFAHPRQPDIICPFFERRDQAFDRSELQATVAPLQFLDRLKPVVGNCLCDIFIQRRCFAGHSKGAIFNMPSGAPGNLCEFFGLQVPHPATIKLGQRGKCDMADIKVQPHANGIRSNEIVDIAVLIHFDLRIAGARRQCPHDNGGTAFCAAQQLSNRIYIFTRKPDNCRSLGHFAYLFRTCVGQLRHSLAAHEIDLWHHRRDGAAHRFSPQKQRFMQATRMQKPVGEHMPAFRIAAKLNFIDGKKIATDPLRHGFDRAHPIGRPGWHNPLFTRHKRHDTGPAHRNDPVVNLARKQAQRQANHTGPVGEHPLNGVVRFASICRPKHGRDPGPCHDFPRNAGGSAARARAPPVAIPNAPRRPAPVSNSGSSSGSSDRVPAHPPDDPVLP